MKRSCIDNIYTLNEIVQGRLKEGKQTYALFLDVQKAYTDNILILYGEMGYG